MRDVFTDCKTLSKVEPMCLEVKLKEAKFIGCFQSLKSKKQRTANCSKQCTHKVFIRD